MKDGDRGGSDRGLRTQASLLSRLQIVSLKHVQIAKLIYPVWACVQSES